MLLDAVSREEAWMTSPTTGSGGTAMYATCLHCNAALGRNDVIEHFPVGRRLAFDGSRGRLWVVCLKCRRWNLTPLEERWEAIEECERLFRESRLRTSTDNIGLARIAGRTDLVRVGTALRPEMAAWRYGDELRRRWKRHRIPSLVLNTQTLPVASSGAMLFVSASGGSDWAYLGLGLSVAASMTLSHLASRDLRARVVLPDGQVSNVRHLAPVTMTLEAGSGDGWSLRLGRGRQSMVAEEGPAARTLRGVLAYHNAAGIRPAEIADAVALCNRGPDARTFIARVARAAAQTKLTPLTSYPSQALLALEMALHDASERRAMEGELDALAAEWELAEEVAQVADDMFLPDAIRARFDGLNAARTEGP
jgi:hypothetical protein